MIVRDIEELVVLNDEAHHIHDKSLVWFKSIQDIHHRLVQKDAALSLQVDVTATPRHNNGAIFVQTVADYPLVEAKGREDLDVPRKMARLKQWCEDVNRAQKEVRYDFVFVDEGASRPTPPRTFADLVRSFREYKG